MSRRLLERNRRLRQKGFALPAAIFLSVFLGALSAALLLMTTRSTETSASEIQGAKAFQAAKAGVQYGAAMSVSSGSCWSGDLPSSSMPELNGFKASVSCTSSTADEGGGTLVFFSIVSTGCNASSCPVPSGGEGRDYAERVVRAVVVRCQAGTC